MLGLGRHEQAIVDADELIASHPLRESAWAHLMLALYRAGRRAEALDAYGRLRRVLREELGVSPSAELRELESQILAEDPVLDRPTRAPRVLPSPRTPFIGREALVRDVCTLFEGHRLITLWGAGGVGRHASRSRCACGGRSAWQHGVWWVDLNGHRGQGWLTRRLVSVSALRRRPAWLLTRRFAGSSRADRCWW